jgi:hypothetical protein
MRALALPVVLVADTLVPGTMSGTELMLHQTLVDEWPVASTGKCFVSYDLHRSSMACISFRFLVLSSIGRVRNALFCCCFLIELRFKLRQPLYHLSHTSVLFALVILEIESRFLPTPAWSVIPYFKLPAFGMTGSPPTHTAFFLLGW